MKQNLKNQLLILSLLLAMAITIFICVLIIVIDIFWIVKLFVLLASIVLTMYLFKIIKSINKKLVYIPKDERDIVEEKCQTKSTNKIRCPKCYNYYDGEFCFVCGYKKEQK